MRVTDCEYSFNVAHEDLRNLVGQQPGVSSYYTNSSNFTDDHGTAVLGILGSAENNYGMTGTLPEAGLRFYGEYATVNGTNQYRAAAVIATSLAADVVSSLTQRLAKQPKPQSGFRKTCEGVK